MTQSRKPRRREWVVTDIYVCQPGAPEESGLVCLQPPAKMVAIGRSRVQLTGLVPLHPSIDRQARWCAALEGVVCQLVPPDAAHPRPWIDLANKALGVELRCYLPRSDVTIKPPIT